MTQIHIDLPDELAKKVKAWDLPVSAICQRALRAEISHRQPIEQAAGIIVQVGNPAVDLGFSGRWLIVPDPDKTQAGMENGAYWGVALTKRGRIAGLPSACGRAVATNTLGLRHPRQCDSRRSPRKDHRHGEESTP